MFLYLMRHGIAEDFDPSRHRNDSERELTAEGRDKLKKQAHGLATLDLGVELIVCSPYARARATADIARSAFKNVELIESDTLVPHAMPKVTLHGLSKLPISHAVMLVGHEPHLSALTATVLGHETLQVEMKKGALVGLELDRFEPRAGRLHFLLPPKVLRSIS